MSQSFIRLSEVQRRTGYSKPWLYRFMSQGKSRPPSKSDLAPSINQRIEDSRQEVV